MTIKNFTTEKAQKKRKRKQIKFVQKKKKNLIIKWRSSRFKFSETNYGNQNKFQTTLFSIQNVSQ